MRIIESPSSNAKRRNQDQENCDGFAGKPLPSELNHRLARWHECEIGYNEDHDAGNEM